MILEWFSAKELTLLEGMPSSIQAINTKARNDKWLSRKRFGVQGKAKEYHIESFPAEIQERINFLLNEFYSGKPSTSAFIDAIKSRLIKKRTPANTHLGVQNESIVPLSYRVNSPERAFNTPTPSYVEQTNDSLEIWMNLFQRTTDMERQLIISYIARKGLGGLISLIQNDLLNSLLQKQNPKPSDESPDPDSDER